MMRKADAEQGTNVHALVLRMDSSLFRSKLEFAFWHSTYCKVNLASSHDVVQEGVNSVELRNRELSINLTTQ